MCRRKKNIYVWQVFFFFPLPPVTTTTTTTTMAIDRQTLVFFIIMFIFLSLPSGNEQPHSDKDRETLQTYQQLIRNSLSILQNSTYALGYGNITGYQLSYKDQLQGKSVADWPIHEFSPSHPWVESQEYSILPDEISQRVRKFWGISPVKDKAYLLNISGRADGEFQLIESKVKPTKLSIPKYLKEYYKSRENSFTSDEPTEDNREYFKKPIDKKGNVTTNEGVVSIAIKGSQYNFDDPKLSRFVGPEDKVDNAICVSMDLDIKDYPEIEDHSLVLNGVYFQETGSLIGVTNSAKFYGNYGLSHLTMGDKNFAIAKTLMTQFSNMTNDNELTMDDMNYGIVKAHEQCEYIAFIQFAKTNFTHERLREIDEELETPTGRPLPHEIPKIVIEEYLLYSPDCGKVLSLKPGSVFSGKKTEVTRAQMRNVLTGILVLVGFQLFLVLRQIKNAQTPGQLSLISSKTLFLLGYQDSLVAIMTLLLSTITVELYLILACIATIAFILCGVFEMRFMVSVLTTQANERGTSWWEILRGANAEREQQVPEEGPILPIANDPSPQETVPNQAWQETSYSNSIFASGFSITIVSMFIIFSSLQWRIQYRKAFEYVSLVFVNSFWVPQFFRNTLKNRRKSFTWEFAFGTSVIRVLPIYYFALVKGNPLRHRYDPILCIVVSVWLGVQLLLLVLQNQFGPRFWINEKWLPKAYEYQRLLSMKDLQEEGFSSELLENLKTTMSQLEDQDIVTSQCMCPICMTDVDLPILVKEDKLEEAKRKVNIKGFMITPCHHIFHTECLENWMKYKLQCPVCRKSLPPI